MQVKTKREKYNKIREKNETFISKIFYEFQELFKSLIRDEFK